MKFTFLSSKKDRLQTENGTEGEQSTLFGNILKVTRKSFLKDLTTRISKRYTPVVKDNVRTEKDVSRSRKEPPKPEKKPSAPSKEDIKPVEVKNPLLDYFQYLRDASKNLSMASDWYKCLLSRKNENMLPTTVQCNFATDLDRVQNKIVIQKSSKLYPYFQSFKQILKKDNTRHIFLGIGLVLGRHDEKKVFSSIVNLPVNFVYHDKSDVFTLDIDYRTSLINYDLITTLVPDYFSQEYSIISEEILNTLSAFETSLTECFSYECIEKRIHIFLERFFPLLKDTNITEYSNPYKYEDVASTKNKKSPLLGKHLFFKEGLSHFFINKIPGKISTWQGLNSFCEQVSMDVFDNEVLNTLLKNVLNEGTENDIEFNNHYPSLDVASLHLPLTLSAKQQVAIKNAFEAQVSYIQGPPGTGKSYTISALVLASMLLGKKILVVAQKDTAINVVKEKITSFFDKDTIVPFIYFNKEQKRTLKNDLKQLLIKADEITSTEIVQMEFDLKSRIAVIDRQENRLKEINQAISILLDKYADFYKSNQTVIKEKDNFYGNPVYKAYIKDNIHNTKKDNQKFIDDIKRLQTKFNETGRFSVYERHLLKHHESVFNNYFLSSLDFKKLLKNRILAIFVEDWMTLSHHVFVNDTKQDALGTEDQFLNLKYQAKTLVDTIHEMKLSIFKIAHKKALFEQLLSQRNKIEIDAFEKMLHFSKDEKVADRIKNINFDNLLNVFPVWLCEIQKINEVLPLTNELFDLVVVDEASQVDLAQIIPVFYRGKNICVVGDHKQLGLESVGLNFSLNKKFDKMMWDKFKPSGLSHEEAGERNLTITKASILDLLRSEENSSRFREVMLDEHFRSLPGLASFNNSEFYDGSLKIMTETPDKALVPCFSGVCVPDGVKSDKTNKKEAETVVDVVKYITGTGFLSDARIDELKSLNPLVANPFIPRTPTIGIISLLRDQVELIDDMLDNFSLDLRDKYRLFCGTPEEFQGDEFDIIILSTVLDQNSKNTGHYSNPNRFNVATSRAKFYTIVVYSHVTQVPLYDKYLKHFGIIEDNKSVIDTNVMKWTYDENKFDSHFEKNVADYINLFRTQLGRKHKLAKDLEIYNQVETCGMKRLDFVVYNPNNNKSLAIEVDGIQHFNMDSRSYSDHHLERMEILTRAGWKILNTPYFLWYKKGKLCPESVRLQKELKRIKDEMEIVLIG